MRTTTFLNRRATLCALLLLAAPAAGARAQTNPEMGDVTPPGGQFGGAYQQQGVQPGTPPPGAWQQQPLAPQAPLGPEAQIDDAGPSADGDSDHQAVVERLGIGFFGVMALPIIECPTADCPNPAVGSVSAPTIGARYWLAERLGIEAALGLNISSGENGALQTSTFGFAVHGGVPLALAYSGHFVFEVIPQFSFGVSSGSYEVEGAVPISSDVSGLLFEIGARAGAEIHFGFIDIPQLALQGTVGLMLRTESREVETQSGVGAATTAELSQLTLSTTVDGEPWDIFTGAITAIYYF